MQFKDLKRGSIELKSELLNSVSPDSHFVECAKLHQKVITDGFLTKLGPKFLSKFYHAIAELPDSFLIVSYDDRKKINGLIAGSTNSRHLMRQVLSKRAIFFLPHMLKVVFNPSFIRKIIEVILYPSKQDFKDLPDAEILNFAVLPEAQGKGTGRHLFIALCDEMKKRDVQQMRIVTGASQESAQSFYVKVGAELISSISVHGTEKSNTFIYSLK